MSSRAATSLRASSAASVCMEPLESRVHLSLPAYKIGDPLPTPGARRYVVDNTDRLNLRAQLAGSTIGGQLAALNSSSATFAADFDKTLLDYMKTRTSPAYDFAPSDVPTIVNFVKNSTDADQKKLYTTEVTGTTPVAGIQPIKQVADNAVKDPDVDMQRLPHLGPTAMAYRFLNTSAYGTAVANTLYLWAGQAPPPTLDAILLLYKPSGSSKYVTNTNVAVLPAWAALDTGVRVYPLLTTWNLMAGTSAWTPELNTLFMTLIYQHGRVLHETAKSFFVDESATFGVDGNPLGRSDNNKALQLCGALLTLSRMFPEFGAVKDAGSTPDKLGWKNTAKLLLKDAVWKNYRGKYYTYLSRGGINWKFDGTHREMSPGYGQNMIETYINQLKFSQINGGANDPFLKDDPELRQLLNGEYVLPDAAGKADPAAAIPLATRVEALYQIVAPDGTAPSVGDTPRPSLAGTFLRAQLVLPSDTYARNHEYTWPTSYPAVGELFSLWKKNVSAAAQQHTYGTKPVYNRYGRGTTVPASVSPENRPNSPGKYSSWLPGGGYYMLRSDKGTRDDVQLTFDVGLMGLANYNASNNTAAHTQYDLLNFELYGYQRPMIEDPGLFTYGNSRERNWVTTTVAHNSFTVDNYSHARMDGYYGVIPPADTPDGGVAVTGFHYGYQKLDVDSDHPNGTGPALARTIWFDKDNTFLIVDWGHQTTTKTHTYKIAFTLPTPPTEPSQAAVSKGAPVTLRDAGDPSQGIFTEAAKGNVFLIPLRYKRNPKAQKVGLVHGTQDAATGDVTGPFVTSATFDGNAAPADRLFVTQTGYGANFVTLVHTYSGKKNKDQVIASAFAEIISQTASTVVVRVTKNGVSKDVSFTNPFNAGLAPSLTTQSVPTEPTTVWPRKTNPITGGYPSLIEAAEGIAPVDLTHGKHIIGPGDSTPSTSASAASSTPSFGSPFSQKLITDIDDKGEDDAGIDSLLL